MPEKPSQNKAAARPAPPEDLAGEALACWHRLIDGLDAQGTLDVTDLELVTVTAETWAINREAMKHVREHGAVVKWPNGLPGPNPFYKISRETAAQLKQQLAELGVTPATRKAGEPGDEGLDVD